MCHFKRNVNTSGTRSREYRGSGRNHVRMLAADTHIGLVVIRLSEEVHWISAMEYEARGARELVPETLQLDGRFELPVLCQQSHHLTERRSVPELAIRCSARRVEERRNRLLKGSPVRFSSDNN